MNLRAMNSRNWVRWCRDLSRAECSFWCSALMLVSLSLITVLFLQKQAHSQEQASGPLVLTLAQIIDRALAESPELGESRSDIVSAESDLAQAEAAYYPRTEVTAVIGPVKDAERPIVYNNRIHDPSSDSIGIFGRLDFTINQPLYTFGKLDNRREAAKKGLQAKELEVVKKKNEITLRAKQLYYALVIAREGVGAADESNEFFSDARKRVSRLLELNAQNVQQSDQYLIDAYGAEVSGFRAEAEKGERVAYAALKAMLNLPPKQEFEPVEKELPAIESSQETEATVIAQALEQRPEFKQLDAALEAQKLQVDAAHSDRYPSFFAAVEGSLAGAPDREKFDNPYIQDEFNHVYAGVVAGMQWHYDFGILKARVDQEQAQYTKLLYTKTYAQRSIPVEVISAYQDAVQWQKIAGSSEAAARASRRWIVTAFTDFDMGVGTAKNIFDAIEKYSQNRGNYLEALYNYHLSVAQLSYAVGATAAEPAGSAP